MMQFVARGRGTVRLHRGLASSAAARSFDWNAHQSTIPRLPLPQLNETLERYIEAVTPLASPAELAQTRTAVAEFASNAGPRLQTILEERDSAGVDQRNLGTATSYVRPFWNAMYLSGRYPVNINSNPALLMKDLPQKGSLGQPGVAAVLTAAITRWYVAMKSNRVEPDFMDKAKKVPGCMEEYAFLFAETRIPRPASDELVVADESKHIAILRGADVYALDVIDTAGAVASPTAIASRFASLIAATPTPAGSGVSRVGTLTSQERNWWATQRDELLLSSVNRQTIGVIDRALFVVALDHGDHSADPSTTLAWGVTGNGEHRWWDKNFTLQVDAAGTACINFEHAPYDGATVVRMLEDMWHEACGLPLPSGRPDPHPAVAVTNMAGECTRLAFELTAQSEAAVQHATAKSTQFASITKFKLLDFRNFGKSAMKRWRMSPDGCIQVAYQLAYHRLHGDHTVSVYESCSTKRFLRGRTEAIRSNTTATSAFVGCVDELLQQGPAGLQAARQLLDAAVTRHRGVAAAASQATGIDRHLFSLVSLANEVGFGADAPIFADAMWTKLNTSVLSTSNVNSDALVVLGFGAVCPHGYGLGYTVEDDSIRVSVANYTGDPDTGGSGFGGVAVAKPTDGTQTNCEAMANEISRALLDLERIATATPAAKL
eukprot:m.416677 g.416677  ORF g.416677 m.416677 type:complete len:661 (+) comp30061_c0_seq1:74-2056(+)